MVDKRPCVYILASRRNGTLYIGVTADLTRRIWEHRTRAVSSFTRDYAVHTLVFAEFHDTMESAILREKRMKKWRRQWKKLIRNGATSMMNWRFNGRPGSPLSRGRRGMWRRIPPPMLGAL
ncbi:MAG TPA: GIY-YIG nuclease family protein [Stellaceae bacterium]